MAFGSVRKSMMRQGPDSEAERQRKLASVRRPSNPAAFNRAKRQDLQNLQSADDLIPANDNGLQEDTAAQLAASGWKDDTEEALANRLGTSAANDNEQQNHPPTPEQQDAATKKRNAIRQVKNLKQRGLGTQLYNRYGRNREEIKKTQQANAILKNQQLKQIQEKLDKVREKMEPIESKIHRLQLQRTAMIIWAVFLAIVALICAITIFLIPIVTLPLLGISTGMIWPILERTAKIHIEEEKIKKPKKEEEKLVKEKEGVEKQIKQNERKLQILINQSVLSRKRQEPATT